MDYNEDNINKYDNNTKNDKRYTLTGSSSIIGLWIDWYHIIFDVSQ